MKRIFAILKHLLSTSLFIIKYRKTARHRLNSELSDLTLTPKELWRIRQYVYLALIFGRACYGLHNKQLSKTDLNNLILFGLSAPLHDDLVDNQQKYNIKKAELIAHFTDELTQNVVHKNQFNRQLIRLNKLQKLSDLQTDSKQNITRIASGKGAVTALLFRSLLNLNYCKRERRAFYLLGILFQYMDDCFDYYEDSVAGIRNLYTQKQSVDDFRQEFAELFQKTKAAFTSFEFKKSGKRNFSLFLDLTFSRVFVCLYFYEQQIRKGVQTPNPENRKQWICDMETVTNMYRTIRYAVKLHGNLA